jgi:cephalosporin-C deacetylase-like acetyl esterase
MNSEAITFTSQGLKLSAIIDFPSNMRADEKRPAMIVLHGFGSNKNAHNVLSPVSALGAKGYITMRFDMQGCGESEGTRGHLLCLDQVQNTQDALGCLAAHPNVRADQIGLIGSSFGAAVALYTGAIDERVSLVISSSKANIPANKPGENSHRCCKKAKSTRPKQVNR